MDRTAEAVRDSIENTPAKTGDPTVRHISGEAPLDNAGKLVSALPETSNLIVDPLDVLESQEPPSRFRSFMNDLQNHIFNTDSLGILHCLDGRSVPPLRDTTEHFADVIFHLSTDITGDEVENRLAIPKFRGGRAPADVIKLDLVEEVSIDTSRDIA
jgi:archaellum biogenesis ATPase FlaH